MPSGTASTDWTSKLLDPQEPIKGSPVELTTTGSPESNATCAAGSGCACLIASHSAASRDPSAWRHARGTRRPSSARNTVARRTPSSRAMRSHTTISISSSEGAFVAASVSSSRKEVSDWWRSLSSMLPARATAAATIDSSDWSSIPASRGAGSIESIPTVPPAISGSKRTDVIPRSAASSAGMRSSSCASSISTGRPWTSTETAAGMRASGMVSHSAGSSSIPDGLSTASGETAWRGAS